MKFSSVILALALTTTVICTPLRYTPSSSSSDTRDARAIVRSLLREYEDSLEARAGCTAKSLPKRKCDVRICSGSCVLLPSGKACKWRTNKAGLIEGVPQMCINECGCVVS
ncbi:hypothetical protein CC1G_02398 [Coprinopsis cinerea okayama7|uniref:Uncharacterized protein n=1 Tax=Coprinopsis cinerea (strain Okayama-7 / 130 / ATCC MYA-4618 / FGSC 9003) TaxID=240176 RepID=A8N7Z1_COPC7|nr:hypothetical protein CC1G_02398 [Coprinopsis cinerea okayama7\|eukprot:XP_001830947.2 hypothetical protein CC1G_02398 [Coprinopsis cinerea okayama7\